MSSVLSIFLCRNVVFEMRKSLKDEFVVSQRQTEAQWTFTYETNAKENPALTRWTVSAADRSHDSLGRSRVKIIRWKMREAVRHEEDGSIRMFPRDHERHSAAAESRWDAPNYTLIQPHTRTPQRRCAAASVSSDDDPFLIITFHNNMILIQPSSCRSISTFLFDPPEESQRGHGGPSQAGAASSLTGRRATTSACWTCFTLVFVKWSHTWTGTSC